jgi:hypothetical protein
LPTVSNGPVVPCCCFPIFSGIAGLPVGAPWLVAGFGAGAGAGVCWARANDVLIARQTIASGIRMCFSGLTDKRMAKRFSSQISPALFKIAIGEVSRPRPSCTRGHPGPYPSVRRIKRGRYFKPVPKVVTMGHGTGFGSFEQRRRGFILCRRSDRMAGPVEASIPTQVLQSFRLSAKLVTPTTTFADFCCATVRSPYDDLTTQTSRGKIDRLHRTPRRVLSPRPLMTVASGVWI